MPAIAETPDQMLERLERMGLERVRALVARGHFAPKTVGLVKGWIARKEREQLGPVPEPDKDPRVAVERGSRQTPPADTDAKAAHEAAVKAQRTALIAIIVAGIAAVVSLLSLFALAIR